MTPVLVSWAGQLTVEGDALAGYLNLIGTPIPAPDGSLLKPAALYLRVLSPIDREALWSRFEEHSTMRIEQRSMA